ncbi:hypothetical protein OH76DRAFT_185038 [Lentinus brumalis]|uniref:Uncharacterized protein n=1 Tax=Lentinus brumalis TaxID=2498619 RepID=A0A371CN45_9APHY|nr:hypothetical protein OH76DRAFT_185038 [Polyporus brumalis]
MLEADWNRPVHVDHSFKSVVNRSVSGAGTPVFCPAGGMGTSRGRSSCGQLQLGPLRQHPDLYYAHWPQTEQGPHHHRCYIAADSMLRRLRRRALDAGWRKARETSSSTPGPIMPPTGYQCTASRCNRWFSVVESGGHVALIGLGVAALKPIFMRSSYDIRSNQTTPLVRRSREAL